LEKNSGMYSPTRSHSLASNTTSAQDTLDTTDFSENETWGNRAGDADNGYAASGQRQQRFEAFSPQPLLAGGKELLTGKDLLAMLQEDSPVKPRGGMVDYSQSPSPRRKGTRGRKSGCGMLNDFASPQGLGQSPLPAHIKAALDAASVQLDSPKKIRAPPGLEGLELQPPPEVQPQMCMPPGLDFGASGLQDPPRAPPTATRCQTPPPSERRHTNIMSSPCGHSPVRQGISPYHGTLDASPYSSQPPAHIASLWSTSPETACYSSPQKAVRKSPEAASPSIFSTTPVPNQSGTPVPQKPATWGNGLMPSMPPPPLTPPQPASWGGGLVPPVPPQQAMWHAGPGSPVPPQPSSWGSPMPLPPATWGTGSGSPLPTQPATWGAGPTSPMLALLGTDPASPMPPQPATWGGSPVLATLGAGSGSPVPPQPATWGGVPSCPPPAWPAPRSLEAQAPDTIWMDEDVMEGPPGLSKLAKKHVPQWF